VTSRSPQLLLDEPPVALLPSLVRRLGLLEAAIAQQLHYWLQRATQVHGDERWVYKTYQDWSDEIGVTPKAARGALNKLRRDGVVIAIQSPRDARDRTLWWRIDYARFNALDDPVTPSAPEGSPAAVVSTPADPDGRSTRASRCRTENTTETTAEMKGVSGVSARKRADMSPSHPTLTESERLALWGLETLLNARGRDLTGREVDQVVKAARAAGVDLNAIVRRLERMYGPQGLGANRPITDIVALTMSQFPGQAVAA
jgi:hypothetical protein